MLFRSLSWLPTSLPTTNGSPTQIFGHSFPFLLTGYNGSLGTPLTAPSGSSGSNNNAGSLTSYTPGSYYQQVTYTCDVSHMNLSGGITVLTVGSVYHKFQIGFTPAIPKDNTYTFTFVCNFSLARYP